MQDEPRAAHIDRMPGIVAALVAGHDGEPRREQIDYLALPLIAPLSADHSKVHDVAMLADRTSLSNEAARGFQLTSCAEAHNV